MQASTDLGQGEPTTQNRGQHLDENEKSPATHHGSEIDHREPSSLEKTEYLNEDDKPGALRTDDTEPVVTPKTWLVVFVRKIPTRPFLDPNCNRSYPWAMDCPSGQFP